jgi:DNA-binding NarL/FixJ family response regulator
LPNRFAKQVLIHFSYQKNKAMADKPFLSPKEKSVLELAWQGLTNKEIGKELNLAEKTIEEYMTSLYRKTDNQGGNRVLLIRYALEIGWFEL